MPNKGSAKCSFSRGRAKNVSFCYMNVNGLHRRVAGERRSKLEDEDFISSLTKYDIISLVETHCAPEDSIDIPGYHFVSVCRA